MLIETSRVQRSDWATLKELRLSALQESPSAFGATYADEVGSTDDEWRLRATQASTGADRATFLASIDHKAIGIVSSYRPAGSVGEVELVSMWTSAAVRRSGAGRELVRAILDWATESGARSVGLWVVRGNAPGEQLFESVGFREAIGYQPRSSDPCANELRMSLTLDELELSRELHTPPA